MPSDGEIRIHRETPRTCISWTLINKITDNEYNPTCKKPICLHINMKCAAPWADKHSNIHNVNYIISKYLYLFFSMDKTFYGWFLTSTQFYSETGFSFSSTHKILRIHSPQPWYAGGWRRQIPYNSSSICSRGWGCCLRKVSSRIIWFVSVICPNQLHRFFKAWIIIQSSASMNYHFITGIISFLNLWKWTFLSILMLCFFGI